MAESKSHFLAFPLEEPIDQRRYERHATFVPMDLLTERLSPQGYRPEILAARGDLAKRHKCTPLQSLCRSKIRQGITPVYGDDGPPCVKPQHVRPILIEHNIDGRVSAKFASDNSQAAIGLEAVLINRSGAITLGRTGIYLGTKIVFSSEHVFSCYTKASLDAAFLAVYLNSWWGKRSLESGIAGSTGQLQIPQSHVAQLPIPNVGEALQKAIGNKVRKAERLRQLARTQQESVSSRVDGWYGHVAVDEKGSFGWLDSSHLTDRRVDAWFNQKKYVQLADCLEHRADLIAAGSLCRLVKTTVNWNKWPTTTFDYFEIGGIDGQPGSITSQAIEVVAAPSRAKFLVGPWDILVSTVRPNLKSIALVPETVVRAVCSTGFSVLRAGTHETAGYLWACLSHDVATAQLLRWNTGGTYPAIERTVPPNILIPNPGDTAITETGHLVVDSIRKNAESHALVNAAKEDIEALIAGSLDEAKLLHEGEQTAAWLDSNSAPANSGSE